MSPQGAGAIVPLRATAAPLPQPGRARHGPSGSPAARAGPSCPARLFIGAESQLISPRSTFSIPRAARLAREVAAGDGDTGRDSPGARRDGGSAGPAVLRGSLCSIPRQSCCQRSRERENPGQSCTRHTWAPHTGCFGVGADRNGVCTSLEGLCPPQPSLLWVWLQGEPSHGWDQHLAALWCTQGPAAGPPCQPRDLTGPEVTTGILEVQSLEPHQAGTADTAPAQPAQPEVILFLLFQRTLEDSGQSSPDPALLHGRVRIPLLLEGLQLLLCLRNAFHTQLCSPPRPGGEAKPPWATPTLQGPSVPALGIQAGSSWGWEIPSTCPSKCL